MEWQELNRLPVSVFVDYVDSEEDASRPFAWTDVFLREVGRSGDGIILHVWPMTRAVILGARDQLLPQLDRAKRVVRERGYHPVVRNIGGLVVVADEGVLNFSLIIPERAGQGIAITNAYLLMVDFVRTIFDDFHQPIDHFEVPNSYCPGHFDLSIGGKKFAGIAQRRVKNAVAVSIYLSVCGDQEARGQMIADFYRAGLGTSPNPGTYPAVDPASMANVADLVGHPLTVEDVVDRMVTSLQRTGFSGQRLLMRPQLVNEFEAARERYALRNHS